MRTLFDICLFFREVSHTAQVDLSPPPPFISHFAINLFISLSIEYKVINERFLHFTSAST